MIRYSNLRRRITSRFLSKYFAFYVVLFGLLHEPSAARAIDGASCSIAKSAMKSASKIRGLRVLRSVPCRLQDKKQVERYLRDTINEKIPAKRIENEGEAYRLLGIIPQDFDYLNGIIKLYTGQLGGYYDPEKEYYAMAAWMPMMMQLPIAVHELTHALQDQHFKLDDFIDHERLDSDALMAHSAMVEGDATAVMIDYSRSLTGEQPIAKDESVSGIMMQNISGAMLSSALHQAPQALQAMLIFPYVSGLQFAHSLLKEGGYPSIDKAFKRPPISTEEILHPEKYGLQERDFIDVADHLPPARITLASSKPIYSDRYGEFFISTWLGSWVPALEASKAANGWGGDRVSLYELPSSAKKILVWDLRWDTKEDAIEFFTTLIAAYTKRFDKAPVQTTTSASFIAEHVGLVEITLSEKQVLLVIGS